MSLKMSGKATAAANYTVSEDELQGLIFDCDGTLVDTMPAYWYSWERTCRQFGLDFNEKRFYSMAGIPVRDIIQTLVDEAKYAKKGINLDVDTIFEVKKGYGMESIAKVGTPEIKCVTDIVRKYHGKKPLAVASSGVRGHVLASLQEHGLLEYFDTVVTCEDIKNPKPAPDIFLEAAKRIGCDPKKCRGFEDADIGMTSLRSAGMQAVDVRLLKEYPHPKPSDVSVLSREGIVLPNSVVTECPDFEPTESDDGKNQGVFMSFFHFLMSIMPFVVVIAVIAKYFGMLLAEAIMEEALSDD